MRARFLIPIVAFVLGAWVGCHDDVDAACEDGHCECSGNDCICPASGNCDIECTADCNLQCAGSGDCAFACGDGCVAECTGSGNCLVDVGEGGVVRCSGPGDCDIVCHGACTVECPGSGECALACDGEQGPLECGDALACGACP